VAPGFEIEPSICLSRWRLSLRKTLSTKALGPLAPSVAFQLATQTGRPAMIDPAAHLVVDRGLLENRRNVLLNRWLGGYSPQRRTIADTGAAGRCRSRPQSPR